VAAADISDATGALSRQAGKRRSRAVWWVLLFIVVAGLAGGAGWYFGAGPASMVAIPESVVSQSPDEATLALEELGLTVAEESTQVSSTAVPAGAVAGTDPAAGTRVTRSTVVTLQISTGPKQVSIPQFVGIGEQDARELATGLDLEIGENESQFSADVAAGVVMGAYGIDANGARIDLVEGAAYFERMPVVFLVSAGDVPAVVGIGVDEAVARLQAVNLTGVPLTPEFNNDVPSGQVIQLRTQTDDPTIRPGDSVNLVVSKGPDLVDVPDVVGDFIPDATKRLTDAGFTVTLVTNVPSLFRSQAEVQSMRPDTAQALRGSDITIVSNY